ncbi:hypothetical protein MME56_004576 [Escherichia coli]|nr:hypothetical protein [Escherichia coli]
MRKYFSVIAIIMFVSISSYGEIITVKPGQGVVRESPISGILTIKVVAGSNGNWTCSQPYTAGIVDSTGISISSSSFGTTSDGVFGLKYLPWPDSDTVVTVYGTTKTTRYGSGTGYIAPDTTYNWSNGKPTGVPSAYSSCLSSYPWNLTPMPSGMDRGNGSTDSNLIAKIHVGPKMILSKKYTPATPSLRYTVRDAGTFLSSGALPTLVDPLVCSIIQPDIITFGEVNITKIINGQVLAYSGLKNLQVNCDGADSLATISVTGTPGSQVNTLKMVMKDSPDSPAPAEIRGFIGSGNWPNSGFCDDNSSFTGGVNFDATKNQKIIIGSLTKGINNIPYSFTLCSTGEKNSGEADSTATINITWN